MESPILADVTASVTELQRDPMGMASLWLWKRRCSRSGNPWANRDLGLPISTFVVLNTQFLL